MKASDQFSPYIGAVAEKLLGKPSIANKRELRFGSHGSMSVDLEKGTWFSHEENVGGGVLDLIQRHLGIRGREAVDWLREHVGANIPEDQGPRRPNGRTARSGPTEDHSQTSSQQFGKPIAYYVYNDIEGTPRFRVVRYEPKTFRQERYDPKSGRFIGGRGCMDGVQRLPYRLDEIADEFNAMLWIVEGEKDVDRLFELGEFATCNPGGAGKWDPAFATYLDGRHVIVTPDNDEAGRRHAADVADSLRGVAASIQILELPGLPEKGDVSDWLKSHAEDELRTLAFHAPAVTDEILQRLRDGRPLRRPCDLPIVDLTLVAEGLFVEQRWTIDQLIPFACSGIFAGPGNSGKSYLELIKLVCLTAPLPFLDIPIQQPIVALAYFSEEDLDQLASRINKICHALSVNPRDLIGRLYVVSTKRRRMRLFEAEHGSLSCKPTDDMLRIVDRAKAIGARYVSLDHMGRYFAIDYHVNNQQVFDLFTHLDEMADYIGAAITVLHHPSKSGIKSIRETCRADAYDMTGGAAALVNAPRFVNTMRWFQNPEDANDRYRMFQSHKANLGKEIALKLIENGDGIVEVAEVLNPHEVTEGIISRKNSRGRPSLADRTFMALEDLFTERHREIALDELLSECVRRGIIKEAQPNTRAWIDRRKTIRGHIDAKRHLIDIRGDGECFALKP